MEFDIIEEFYSQMKNVDFEVYGLINKQDMIYTLGTDSKLIGRIFEMIVQPILNNIAMKYGYILETPVAQNSYPDFIFTKPGTTSDRIAIDVKTTYKDFDAKGILKKYTFTLGSYASYMRSGTKNIEHHYLDYKKHYVIGFMYERNGNAQASDCISLSNRQSIQTPYKNVDYFIQEKHKIVGEKPGSGNTENLGSFKSNDLNDYKEGNGVFAELGEDIYNLYWCNYPRYKDENKNYTDLKGFLEWFKKQTSHPKMIKQYNYDEVMKIIKDYDYNESTNKK